MFPEFFWWFGVAALILFSFWFLCKSFEILWQLLWPHVFGRPKNLHKLAGAKWAVVTGATDGIGRAYAFELASKRFDLILISRSQSKLDTTADEIRFVHSHVQIKTIEFDFSNPNVEDYEQKIFSVFEPLEIGILVNNVGLAYEYPERIDLQHDALKRCADMVVVNGLPTTLLSAHVLHQMAKRKSGILINISTSAALFPMPWWAVYSSIKKYVSVLTLTLRKEFAGNNLIIQTVHPMVVVTKMARVVQDTPSIFGVTPEHFARSAVRTIGLVDETCGCLAHEIQSTFVFRLLPYWLLERMLMVNNREMRAKAIQRLSEETSLLSYEVKLTGELDVVRELFPLIIPIAINEMTLKMDV
ncbi:17beta-hydroxysteroid dehydrogenase [Aphelenchoides besseyi]|nr:17beta-hydroxysteroid dehydrogenase [Aphelenchoides besseyi]KAI6193274.1 17beta-hydroxysteroid dehydrogenase [Aphelenchoides besseyi]